MRGGQAFGPAYRVTPGVLLLVALLAACSGGSGAPASGSHSDSVQGSASGTEAVIDGQRPVTVRVPSGYQKGRPAPLLVLLHGYSSDAGAVDDYFHLQPVLDERGVLYVVPNGTPDRAGDRFWNATDACCDLYDSGVDDSGYLQGVIHQVQDRYSVDPRRIFVVGHSNGGFMAYRVACDHSDTVAAIVSVAGAMYDDARKCSAAHPVSVLQVHGSGDSLVPYQGGMINGIKVPSARTTVRDWATFDGCALSPAGAVGHDVATDANTPSGSSPLPGAETRVLTFHQNCKAGSEVQLWTVEGAGHVPALAAQFAHDLVDFLLSHPKS
jgi:polyhydroxybutyrate depolymerase